MLTPELPQLRIIWVLGSRSFKAQQGTLLRASTTESCLLVR